jgi:hypothetical protein
LKYRLNCNLLVDNNELLHNKVAVEPVFQVEINGGRF